MNTPAELKYTKDHEWVRMEKATRLVGTTDHAQSELGDIVFIDINSEGQDVAKEAVFGTIEAVKTVSDLFMPVSGTVTTVNPDLADDPASVNRILWQRLDRACKAERQGRIEGLLTADQYTESIS